MEQEAASLHIERVLCVMFMFLCAVFFPQMYAHVPKYFTWRFACVIAVYFLYPKQSGFAGTNAHKHLCWLLGIWVRFGETVAGLADDSDLMETSSPRQNQIESQKDKMRACGWAKDKVVYLSAGPVDQWVKLSGKSV